MNDTYHSIIRETIRAPGFRRATFGGVPRGANPHGWQRVVVRPVEVAGTRHLQFSVFTKTQDRTHNVLPRALDAELAPILAAGFSNVHLATDTEELDVRLTKKGQVLIGRRATPSPPAPDLAHNRNKDVPLPEGQANVVLETMGVLDRHGRVRPTMRAKFTQINSFLAILAHVVQAEREHLARPVQILDCGCGSSYLTIAAHYYLNQVLQIPARVLGVDINEDVIRKSIAKTAGAGPTFQHGGIGQLTEVRLDIVLALHACDTATDDALAQAINSQARIVLSVPCCHHNLNAQIGPTGPAEALRPILRHGILQQRFADLATDAFRALALRIMGYKTDVIEFIDVEHTARNLMLRAVAGAPAGQAEFVAQYRALKAFLGVTPYIERALGHPFTSLIAPQD